MSNQIEGLITEKCEQRNRIAARREAVEGAPVAFLAGNASDFTPDETVGALPDTAEEALSLINARLPEGADALTADNVFIHYIEAASNNFVGDRYAFLAESTLRNIADDAAAGFAFMNSHRTGSMSTPSELPFGKTFAGEYQSGMDGQGRKRKRAVIGFYMLKGVRPNGDNGPTTDDLDRMIRGGQLQDVSVGLSRGEAICDVCSSVLNDCSHYPGTRRGMTDEQVEAQTARGIPGGRASYTIENARCNEVSGVYDGAVPGAGVKKVLLGKRNGTLNHKDWSEARNAFGSLLSGDFMTDEIFDQVAEAVHKGVQSALSTKAEADSAPAIQSEEGAEDMADNQEGARVSELEAKLQEQAAQIAKFAEEKAEAEKLAQLHAERVNKLESDARRQRFEAEVKGYAGGSAWFGDHGKHVDFLTDLAAAFGEDSAQIKFYTEQQRAHAAQVEESALFSEVGSDRAEDTDSALVQLNAISAKLQADNPRLSHAQAFDAAVTANPALYDKYLADMKGGR